MAEYNEHGQEVPDPTPVSVPGGFQRPQSLSELMKQLIRIEVSRQAVDDGQESFEEADDFDCEEDDDPLSPYEIPEGLPEPSQIDERIEAGTTPHTPPSEAAVGDSGASGAPSTDSEETAPGRKV